MSNKNKQMALTFLRIVKENKDILYVVRYDTSSSIKFINAFNSISSTYSGLIIDCFVDTFRGFTRKYPDFIESDAEIDLEKWLKKNGYIEVKPTSLEHLIYSKN